MLFDTHFRYTINCEGNGFDIFSITFKLEAEDAARFMSAIQTGENPSCALSSLTQVMVSLPTRFGVLYLSRLGVTDMHRGEK